MTFVTPTKTIWLRAAAVTLIEGGLLSVLLSPAQADVTMIAQQTVSTGQSLPLARKIKLFYKGANTRLEVTGEPILLYDGKGNIQYGLDPIHKTYYMTVPTQDESEDLGPSRGGGQVKKDTKFGLHQTDQTMTLNGVTAHQYTVTGTITYSRSQPSGGRQGGRRHRGGGGGGFPGGGGGFPMLIGTITTVDQEGGGYGGSEGRSGPKVLPQWSISGDLWLADTLKFPTKQNTLFAAQLIAASAGPFLQPLADALDKHKGLPLLARITVTHTSASSEENGASNPPIPTTSATNLTVQSFAESPLDDKIFMASSDYALVAAPQTPYDPGAPPTVSSK